jgi:hypothetical protein
MSREDIALEGYGPGGGYQPAKFGLSLREALPILAALVIVELLRTYLGDRTTLVLLGAGLGALFLAAGTFLILDAQRLAKRAKRTAQRGARRLRIEGFILVMVGAAFATSCVLSLLGDHKVALLWLGRAYLAMVFVWLAIPLVRQFRPDGEELLDEAPISPRRRLVGAALLVLIVGILCVSSYLEYAGGYRSGRPELAFPAVIILFGLFVVSMPRNADAPVDMRPAWAIVAVPLAIFFYLMFSV